MNRRNNHIGKYQEEAYISQYIGYQLVIFKKNEYLMIYIGGRRIKCFLVKHVQEIFFMYEIVDKPNVSFLLIQQIS